MTALIDNDVILKISCYGLMDEILQPTCESIDLVGVLGTARFVVRRRITRIGLSAGADAAIARLESFLGRAVVVEPTDEEQQIAADFELAAQRAGLSLDSGESHLCALAVTRQVPRVLTGDKRAIAAIEGLVDADQRLAALAGKVYCLEQLILIVLSVDSNEKLRDSICTESSVDKTLAICFSCRSNSGFEATAECLGSYIRNLRSKAPRVLAT